MIYKPPLPPPLEKEGKNMPDLEKEGRNMSDLEMEGSEDAFGKGGRLSFHGCLYLIGYAAHTFDGGMAILLIDVVQFDAGNVVMTANLST